MQQKLSNQSQNVKFIKTSKNDEDDQLDAGEIYHLPEINNSLDTLDENWSQGDYTLSNLKLSSGTFNICSRDNTC